MKANQALKFLALSVCLGLSATGPAQAGMGSCMTAGPLAAPAPACAGDPGRGQACPLRDDRGRQSDGCTADRDELMRSVGKMAAGGIGIASQVMRALLEEANRYADPEQRM